MFWDIKTTKHSSCEEDMGTKYSRVDQVKFFKGFLPQVLLGQLLNSLSHMRVAV